MNDIKTTEQKTVAQPAKAVWSKPVLKTLHVSLDTAFEAGSGSDGTHNSVVG